MYKTIIIWTLFLCLFEPVPVSAATAPENEPGTEKEGPSHLQGENLTATNVRLSSNFTAEDEMNIVGGIMNSGTSTLSDIVVQFFLGDPGGGGTQIGSDVIIPSLPPGQTVYDSVTWNGFTGSSNLYCVVDPYDSLPEDNEYDNRDSLFVAMRDFVPWAQMGTLGLCYYASSTMIFNLYGADNTVDETLELAGCPHSFLSIDDQFWFLGGLSSLSNNESDFEFAGEIRNLRAERNIESDWDPYLIELKSRIDSGLPVETNIDQYYLPQEDYDTLRVAGSHSGHWIVIVGYTDSSFIINDPGVGLPNLGQTPIPEPEKRGTNVVVNLDAFRTGIESTSGTMFSLLSYVPTGPMPSHETMLGNALRKNIERLEGDPGAFDPYWTDPWTQGWEPLLGISSLSVLREDLNMITFQSIFDSLLAETGGNLNETLGTLNHMCSGMYDCTKGWNAAATYYGTLGYPEAENLTDLFLQLVPIGQSITDNFYDMLAAINGAGGDPGTAEPYLAQLASDFDRAIPLEDSVLVYLTALFGRVDVNETGNSPAIPVSYALYQNYPNPFNPSTTIQFDIPGSPGEKQPARISVFDLHGRYVHTLVDSELAIGTHRVTWDGRRDNGELVPSGTYLYTLKIGKMTYTRKMTLLK